MNLLLALLGLFNILVLILIIIVVIRIMGDTTPYTPSQPTYALTPSVGSGWISTAPSLSTTGPMPGDIY